MKTLVHIAIMFSLVITPVTAFASKSSPPTKNVIDGMQVAADSCIVGETPWRPSTNTKMAAEIAGAVITQGVNYIGKALAAAGEAKTWTITASRNFQGSYDAMPMCVYVMRGSFETDGVTGAHWELGDDWPNDTDAKLRGMGLYVNDKPDFAFEGQIVESNDGSAFTIRPILVTYNNPIGERALRSSSERQVALFFAITPPGTKASLDTAPAGSAIFGKLIPGTSIRYLNGKAGDKYVNTAYESPWFTLAKADAEKPLTLTAMLSETQDEQKFLTFLASVFSDSKVTAAATTQLTTLLVPAVGQQAAQDTVTKKVAAENDADAKLGLAINKLSACKAAADASTTISAAIDARSALRGFKQAGDALTPPANQVSQEMIDALDLQKSAVVIRAACASDLGMLMKP